MSLHTDYTAAPKVVTIGRTVRYAAEPTSWADAQGNTVDLFWTVRRVSTMAFEILALTQSAAEEGAAALQREYTRKYARWTADTDNAVSPPSVRVLKSNALLCTSSITPRRSEGDVWHIEATIDEEDTIVADHEPTYDEFEELFALAFAREEADDGGASFVIDEAHWDSVEEVITVFWSYANIANFNPANVVLQRKQGPNWVTIPFITGTVGHGGGKIESSQNLGFRVVYNLGQSDEVASAVYITNDPAMPMVVADPTFYSTGRSITVTFSVSGAERALAGVGDRHRWQWRILANGVYILPDVYGRMEMVGPVEDLGGGNFRTMFTPWGIYATDETIKQAFIDRGGVYTYELWYTLGENSTHASSTVTLKDYAVVRGCMVVDAIPDPPGVDAGNVCVRVLVETDFDSMGVADTMAVPNATITKNFMISPNLRAVYCSFAHVDWQLAAVFLPVNGSITSPSGTASAFSTTAQVNFPSVFHIQDMAYFAESGHSIFTVIVDNDYYSNVVGELTWSKWVNGYWVDIYPDTVSLGQVTFSEDLRACVVRATWNGNESTYLGSSNYIRILKATQTDDLLTLVLDWNLGGASFDASNVELVINGETYPESAALYGDELSVFVAEPYSGATTIQILYDNAVYSLPFNVNL